MRPVRGRDRQQEWSAVCGEHAHVAANIGSTREFCALVCLQERRAMGATHETYERRRVRRVKFEAPSELPP